MSDSTPIPVQPPDQSQDGQKLSPFGSSDLFLLMMTLVWSTNYSVIKYSFQSLSPLSFNALRFVLASTVIYLITKAKGHNFKIDIRDKWRLIGLGIIANAVYQSLFIFGISRTRAGNAALILSTSPLFTALIGRLRRQEFFSNRGIIGLLLAFGGIVLIILDSHLSIEFGQSIFGDILLIAAAICWAVYTVWTKRYVHIYGPVKTVAYTMISGTPALLLLCIPSLIREDWSKVRLGAWGGMIYSSMLAIVLSHLIWNFAIRKIGSTRTAVYSNLTPVLTLLISWQALGEVPGIGQIAGACVIFVGLFMVRNGLIYVAPVDGVEEVVEEASLVPGRN